MKRWRSPRNPKIFLFGIAAILFLALAVVWTVRIVTQLRGPVEQWPISLQLFLQSCLVVFLVAGAAVLLQRARTHAALRFEMDRNAIYIVQRRNRSGIPLHRVTNVARAEDAPLQAANSIVQRYGAGSPKNRLIVDTPAHRYDLGIVERDQFLRELEERRRLGVVQPVGEGPLEAPSPVQLFLRRPMVRMLLGATLLLNLCLWAVLMWRYAALPETIPLRFDPVGGTAGTRSKVATLFLPLGVTVLWLINTTLALATSRRSWLASDLLLVGSLVLHVALLVAAYFIVTIGR